jgi:RNA-directed DNA polymerase
MDSLFKKLYTTSHLQTAWNALNKTNRDSHGLSQETIASFEQNLSTNIQGIANKIKQKKFKFRPTRGVLIPKKEKGKNRPLQIPEVEDRVVIKGIALILEELFLEDLTPFKTVSFAYQKASGVKSATVDFPKSATTS